jgi:hypothetical protein
MAESVSNSVADLKEFAVKEDEDDDEETTKSSSNDSSDK